MVRRDRYAIGSCIETVYEVSTLSSICQTRKDTTNCFIAVVGGALFENEEVGLAHFGVATQEERLLD
jgi:hypothetical protein